MNIFSRIMVVLVSILVLVNLGLVARFYIGQAKAARFNGTMAQNHLELKPVDNLEVVPVVDFLSEGEGYKTEAGNALLVRTDEDNILFDVGYNKNKETKSPLLCNLEKMGIGLDEIQALAISHNHADHVGGYCAMENRIELTKGSIDLQGKKIFTPVPMTCETANTSTVQNPMLIGEGIGTTGPLAVQMFITGQVLEQGLLVNLRDKGLVVISGCGHPQIAEMVKTAKQITELPVYAVVGGTHLYYTNSNAGLGGRIFGGNTLYCRNLKQQEVINIIDEIRDLGVEKAYISTHDSDQPTLDILAEKFGDGFETLKVGRSIRF